MLQDNRHIACIKNVNKNNFSLYVNKSRPLYSEVKKKNNQMSKTRIYQKLSQRHSVIS